MNVDDKFVTRILEGLAQKVKDPSLTATQRLDAKRGAIKLIEQHTGETFSPERLSEYSKKATNAIKKSNLSDAIEKGHLFDLEQDAADLGKFSKKTAKTAAKTGKTAAKTASKMGSKFKKLAKKMPGLNMIIGGLGVGSALLGSEDAAAAEQNVKNELATQAIDAIPGGVGELGPEEGSVDSMIENPNLDPEMRKRIMDKALKSALGKFQQGEE